MKNLLNDLQRSIRMNNYQIYWSDLAFASKKNLRDLHATFIATPREMSIARFTQLIKKYLPSGNIVVGIADEKYIKGFENQPQFKTLTARVIEPVIDKVNTSNSLHKIYILHLKQPELIHVFEKIKFSHVVLVNGSWQFTFHTRPEYYALVSNHVPFEFESPFYDEKEAISYSINFDNKILLPKLGQNLNEIEMLQAANQVAKNAFDNSFQSGVALGKKSGDKYKLISTAFNKTVPYQTFAWHYGPLRERHMSPPGDLNYYDTIHAETNLIVHAAKNGYDMKGTTLFINLLPCPTCARMLCESDISEIVYSFDHSNGYAVALLEKSGKVVRRLLDNNKLIESEG